MSKSVSEAAVIIEAARQASELAWEQGADQPRQEDAAGEYIAAWDECDEHYTDALGQLVGCYEGWERCAERELEAARKIEETFGDDQHARRALAALGEIKP